MRNGQLIIPGKTPELIAGSVVPKLALLDRHFHCGEEGLEATAEHVATHFVPGIHQEGFLVTIPERSFDMAVQFPDMTAQRKAALFDKETMRTSADMEDLRVLMELGELAKHIVQGRPTDLYMSDFEDFIEYNPFWEELHFKHFVLGIDIE